ncbi:hypothetical protein GQ457_16G016990 [Hibiscus cannabinus]
MGGKYFHSLLISQDLVCNSLPARGLITSAWRTFAAASCLPVLVSPRTLDLLLETISFILQFIETLFNHVEPLNRILRGATAFCEAASSSSPHGSNFSSSLGSVISLLGCHDSKWAGHPGIHRTTALLADQYCWPHMGRDVEAYVKTCLVCQQDKVEVGKPMGLLQPLPIPERPWESISMDFIIGLPKVDDFSSIMVVVDRFSKYATFIPASKVCPAEEAARLFLKNVVKYWGVPKTIVSDRDTRFTGRFWTELFKLLGSDLNFSTSFHP